MPHSRKPKKRKTKNPLKDGKGSKRTNVAKLTFKNVHIGKRIPGGLKASTEAKPLSVQITSKDGKIKNLRFAGRTKSPFAKTMGGHSTAWVGHTDAVRRRLVGKAIAAAADTLKKMFEAHEKLEAMDLSDGIVHKAALEHAQKTAKNYQGSTNTPDQHALQNYIGDYLTFVNYIPVATVASADTHGHGEAKARIRLATYESTGEYTPGKKKVVVGGVVQEVDTTLQDDLLSLFAFDAPMAFRFDIEGAKSDKAILVAAFEMYLRTIREAYPKAFNASGLDKARFRQLLKSFADVPKEHRADLLPKELLSFVKWAKKELERWAKEKASLEEGEPEPSKPALSDDPLATLKDLATEIAQAMHDKGLLTRIPDDDMEMEPLPPPDKLEIEDGDDKTGINEKMAAQILMDGDKIKTVKMSGRTNSPFKDTEGAHTVAWTAHTDALVATLEGKTLKEAKDALVKEVADAMDLEVLKAAWFVGREHAPRLKGAYDALKKFQTDELAGFDGKGTDEKISLLQHYVYHYRELFNLLPLMTSYEGSRNTSAEANARAVLLAHELKEDGPAIDALQAKVDTVQAEFDAMPNITAKQAKESEENAKKRAEKQAKKKELDALVKQLNTAKQNLEDLPLKLVTMFALDAAQYLAEQLKALLSPETEQHKKDAAAFWDEWETLALYEAYRAFLKELSKQDGATDVMKKDPEAWALAAMLQLLALTLAKAYPKSFKHTDFKNPVEMMDALADLRADEFFDQETEAKVMWFLTNGFGESPTEEFVKKYPTREPPNNWSD